MTHYESIFILNPDLSSEQAEKVQQTMTGVVEKNGGTVHVLDDWGVKRLAYEVKKHKKGHYLLMQFSGTSAALSELERNYRLNDGVIKYMTLRIEKDKLKPAETREPAAKSATETNESGE
jgi:small subunit ribosomal protein S6